MKQPGASQLPPDVLAEGRTVVLRLFAAIRLLRGHGANNEAFLGALETLAQSIDALLPFGGGQVRLEFLDDILLLNGAILRVSARVSMQFSALSQLLRERGVGGVGFLREVDPELLRHWLLRLEQPPSESGGVEHIRRSLDELRPYGIETFGPKVLTRQDQQVVHVSSLGFALQAYARAIIGFREFVHALEEGRDPFSNKLNLVRVGQDLVDIVVEGPGLLRKVMDVRDEHRAIFERAAGAYAPRHAASTCVWSLLVGATLGLSRLELLDLGTSALLSKVGFALLPEWMTEKRGELSSEERRQVRLGTVRAVQALIAKSRLSDIMMRRVIVAYEHQRPYASPEGHVTNTHLYSRIVAVTDAFDAMVTPRSWRDALPVQVALSNLEEQAGSRFDPALVRILDAVVRGPKPRQAAG